MPASMTVEELSSQLHLLQNELKERNVDSLSASEKLSKEFLSLNLPAETEVLDVGAGTGYISARLQTRGYTNLDALDEDLPTLCNLQALRLYRNYVWRTVNGLNSTGLREESYDVIVTCTGSSCINPTYIMEMLRILKPGGHLFLTINAAAVEGSSEFGLFDLNLASLQKEGKCNLVKKEAVTDMGSIPVGIFYLLRRLPTYLPPYLDIPVSKELEDAVTKILVDNTDPETTVKFYDSWSEKYDEDLVVIGNYTGHTKCVEAFLKLNLDHSVQILDLAAGTGLLGSEIVKHGYEHVDAIDSSLGMLNKAKKQGIYKNYIHAVVDKLGSIPVNNETYDILLMSNGFAPGQIYPSSLPEILRVCRPGGYILWTMKDGFQTTSHQFTTMDSYIEDLVRQSSAQLIVGPVVFQKYLLETPGRFYMLRKPLMSHWAAGSPQASPRLNRKK